MLRNNNVLRGGLAAAAGAALGACAVFGGRMIFLEHEGTEHDSGATSTYSLNPGDCRGLLDGVQQVTFSKDGYLYRATSLEGACAPIYDPGTLLNLGALSATGDGTPLFNACRFDSDKPNRLNVVVTYGDNNWVQGDVDLSATGEKAAVAAGIPTCESQGIPDIGGLEMPLPYVPQPGQTPLPSVLYTA